MTRVILVLALAACSNLPAIDASQCGNGVLEPGEDCDSSDPRCVQCAWQCDAKGLCADTPARRDDSDYSCGADHVCHAPGGAFQPVFSTAVSYPVLGYVLTDIDNDGYTDVAGLSSTDFILRFGDAAGALDRQATSIVPSFLGSPAVFDIDGDGHTDVVIPTTDGLVGYSSALGVLSPYPLPEAAPPRQVVGAVAIDGQDFGVFQHETNGALSLGVVDVTDRDAPFPTGIPCGDATEFSPDLVDVFAATPSGGPEVIVIALLGSGTLATSVCVFTISGPPNGRVIAPVPLQLTLETPVTKLHPVLVDLDNDGCPSLVLSDTGAHGFVEYVGDRSGADCAFATTAADLPPFPSSPPHDALLGFEPLVPKLGGASLALVTAHAIYSMAGSTPTLVQPLDPALDHIASGDFDGDGQLDLVGFTSGNAELDLLFRNPSGFLLTRTDTVGPVARMIVGDFDGNGIADVCYTAQLGGQVEQLDVAYGTTDRPLPPITMATLSAIHAMLPLQIADSSDPQMIVGDALIVTGDESAASLSIYHGSPQRTLLAYFDPRPALAQTTFTSVTAGNFVDGDGPDLIAIDQPSCATQTTSDYNNDAHLWQLDNMGAGTLQAEAAHPSVASCPTVFMGIVATFPLPDYDRVLELSAQGIALIDPHATFPNGPVASTPWGTAVPLSPNASFRSLIVADLDGTPPVEAVLTFAPRQASEMGGEVVICSFSDPTAAPTSCMLFADPSQQPNTTCYDAALARVDALGMFAAEAPATPALVVVCDSGVYRVRWETDHYGADKLFDAPFGASAIQVGDLTGDGVADVVLTGFTQAGEMLWLYPQCTNHGCAP